MIPASMDDVRKYLGDDLLYVRSLEYHRQRRVLSFSRGVDGNIRAVVKGAGRGTFGVGVQLAAPGFSASCTCPAAGVCEHIGAVLFYHLDDFRTMHGPISRPGVAHTFAGSSVAKALPKEQFLALGRQEGRAHVAVEQIRDFLSIHDGVIRGRYPTRSGGNGSGDGQRYRLVFTIQENGSAFTSYRWVSGEVYSLRPGLRYLKKDGADGRFAYFNPANLTEAVLPDAGEILSSILTFGVEGKEAPLSPFLDTLISHPAIEVYAAGRNGPANGVARIRFTPIARAEISFSLKKTTGASAEFTPLIRLLGEDGSVSPAMSPPVHAGMIGPLYVMLDVNENTLLYRKSDVSFARVLHALGMNQGSYTYAQIRELEETLTRVCEETVYIDIPPDRIRILNPGPVPVLHLDTRMGNVQAWVAFAYQGTEVRAEDERDSLVDESEHRDSISVVRRRTGEERLALESFQATCGPVIDTRRSTGFGRRKVMVITLQAEQFLVRFGPDLLGAGWRIVMQDTEVKRNSRSVGFHLSRSGEDWLSIRAGMEEGDRFIELEPDPVLLRLGLVKAGGSFHLISREDIARLMDLEQLGLSGAGELAIPAGSYGLLAGLADRIVNLEAEEFACTRQVLERIGSFSRITPVETPSIFQGVLRPYQKAGLSWLMFLREYGLSGCLADDMGLGKTVQTLALLARLAEDGNLGPVLIVVPVSTMGNWEREIATFTPRFSVLRHAGPSRAEDPSGLAGYDIILVSYRTLLNDVELFGGITFDYLALDEAQNVKNSSTDQFRAVKSIRAAHRLAITGTPIENDTQELWSLMHVLMPGLLGSLADFRRRFSGPIEKKGDGDAAALLRKIVFPFILRRKKEAVASELPAREEIVLYAEMDGRQSELYERFRRFYRDAVEQSLSREDFPRTAMKIIEGLLKLRQIALFPGLVDESYELIPSCKFDLFTETLSGVLAEGHKVLVFSQFVQVLRRIRSHLNVQRVDYSYLDGSTQSREAQINSFQQDPRVRAFLLSLKAGGVGINLTAADYVFIFDPWWNPAVEAQAIDRSHRIGQDKKVIAYKLIVKDTVEEKILALQQKKRSLVESLVTEDAGFFKSLSREELVGFFS